MDKFKTILDEIRKQGKYISSDCNGNKTCGKCIVKITPTLDVSFSDRNLIQPALLEMGYRLACDHQFDESYNIDILEKDDGLINSSIFSYTKISYIKREKLSIAIDIGTTTVVVKIINANGSHESFTDSFFNPQRAFGSDVINRIKAANEGHLKTMHLGIVSSIESTILNLCEKFNLLKMHFENIVISCNTTMTYLLLCKDPRSLGEFPFNVSNEISFINKVTDIFPKLTFFTGQLFIVPYSSAFIGGDIVSGIVACDIDVSNNTIVLIDLGTNGEMIIGNNEKMISVSTAAGPAFEGGNIECGMPSISGAISNVKIINQKLSFKTIGNVSAKGICGSGLIQSITSFLESDIIDETGAFLSAVDKYYFTEDNHVYLSQKDIRELQLAKAAIQTGFMAILKNGIINSNGIHKIYISGGFGSSIRAEDLSLLGIIPRSLLDKCETINNSSLSGAVYLALTNDFNRFINAQSKIKNISLAELNDFNDIFINSMTFEQNKE